MIQSKAFSAVPISSVGGTATFLHKGNEQTTKPDLKNFAQNILPFQHVNIVQETGFYAKVIGLVKNLRKKT